MFFAYSFFVPDIRCVNCHNPIKDALLANRALPIDRIEIDDKEVSIHVPTGTDELWLQQKISDTLRTIGHQPVFSDESFQEQSSEQTTQHWFQGIVGCVSGLTLMMLCFVVGPMSMGLLLPMTLLSGALTLILGAGSYRRAFMEWTNTKQLSMDSLFAVSTIIVLIISVVSLFVPGLPMMLDTGLLIFGFRHLGLAIESSITRSMQMNTRFVDRLPQTVQVASDDYDVCDEKPLDAVKVGDLLELQPGDMIPLDGVCLNETADIYDDIITGSYLPRRIQKGESLLSGMRVAEDSDALILEVTQPLDTSHLKRRDELNAKTRFENKAGLELTAKTLVNYFIPTVLVFALVSGVLLACFFPWTLAIRCAIGVLVSACPCTLGLVVPLAVKIGLKKASDSGVQFRSKEQLQHAGEVDCVVFDLNGTLTCGVPEVLGDIVWDKEQINREACFRVIALLEKKSKHPYGRALYAYVKDKTPSEDDVDVQRHHSGVSAQIDDEEYLIGNQQILDENGIDPHAYHQENHLELKPCERFIYLVRSQRIVAHVVLHDPLRQDARPMVDGLRALDKTVYICTGDVAETAQGYAQQLNIPVEHIKAKQRCTLNESDEENKAMFIRRLTAQGHCVAMVGDAGNDADAISASHFGLALRSAGSDDVTQAKAGAIIYSSSLLPVISAFAISQETVSHIKQNLFISLGYNLLTELLMGGLLVALGVVLNPSVGAALMIVQMCLILGNAYRFQQAPVIDSGFGSEVLHGVGEDEVSESVLHSPASFFKQNACLRDELNVPDLRRPGASVSPLLTHSPHFLSRVASQLEWSPDVPKNESESIPQHRLQPFQ